MGPSLNKYSNSIPGGVKPSNAPSDSIVLLKLCAFFLFIIDIILPILDYIDFAHGWVIGYLFAPKSNPVRQGSGTDAVIISGSSTGIGYDAAVSLAKRGIIVFAGVRSQKDLDRLNSLNISTLIPLQLDVTSSASIQSAKERVSATLNQLGNNAKLVGIVNNAGVPSNINVDVASREELDKIFGVNVYGALELTQAFLPLIRQHRRGGRIVYIGSAVSFINMPTIGVYTASKRGAEAIFETMQQELSGEGIQVSIIRPGGVRTAIMSKHPVNNSALGKKYAERAEIFEKYFSLGIAPSHVTRSIAHALTATYPLTSYAVGIDCRLGQRLRQLLPDHVYNKLFV